MNGAAFDASAELRRAGSTGDDAKLLRRNVQPPRSVQPLRAAGPAEAERDKLSLDASAGIGLVRSTARMVISDVVPNGPGAAAGARVGDEMLAVDGQRSATPAWTRVATC
jgi:predicted metalloprotease with PDZ domain